jgi:hypothetical protein
MNSRVGTFLKRLDEIVHPPFPHDARPFFHRPKRKLPQNVQQPSARASRKISDLRVGIGDLK